MSSQETPIPKKRGPKPTGWGTPVMVRMHAEQLAELDAWIATFDPPPTRPEAIRFILAEKFG